MEWAQWTGSLTLGESRILGVTAVHRKCEYVVEKGSIAIDGISLTVASCESGLYDSGDSANSEQHYPGF